MKKRILAAIAAAIMLTFSTIHAAAEEYETSIVTVVETVPVEEVTETVTDSAAEEIRRQSVDEIAAEIMKIAEKASPEEIEYIRTKISEGVQYLNASGLDKVAVMITNHSDVIMLGILALIIGIYAAWRIGTNGKTRRLTESVRDAVATNNNNAVAAAEAQNKTLTDLCEKLAASDERCEALVEQNRILLNTITEMLKDEKTLDETVLRLTTAAAVGSEQELRALSALISASGLEPEFRDRLFAIINDGIKQIEEAKKDEGKTD